MTLNQNNEASVSKLVIYAPTSVEELNDQTYDYVSKIDQVGTHISGLEQEVKLLKEI